MAIHPITQLTQSLGKIVIDRVASVHQVFSGPVAGDALLILDPFAAATLTELLTDVPPLSMDLDPSSREVFTEVGNIVLNACIGTFGNMLEVPVSFSVPDVDVTDVHTVIDRMLESGDAFRYALIVTAGFRLRDSAVTGYVVIVLTVQSLKRLLEALDRWQRCRASMPTPTRSRRRLRGGMLQWLENQASQGLFTTDRDLVIRTWNRWLATATGLPPTRSSAGRCLEVVPSLVERGLDAHYHDALGGQVKVLSHTLHRYLVPCPQPTATTCRRPARIAPLINGEDIVGTITVIEDVGERLAPETRLRAQIAAAEDARAQAEEASRAKDDFLATLSHEIRTPLSAVLGWIHLLKAREPDAATVKRAIEVIERNAKSQLTLISDMLDMARISSGKLRIEMTAVNMRRSSRGAIDAVRPAADAKSVRLVADLPPGLPIVSGDADRLLQITWNILSNAVKFTGDGGMVVVSLRSDRTGTHLTVADTGQGIEPKFLSQVFDRFKQADTSAGAPHGGLGLGLALVKDLVAMHGGSVEAASPGLGLGSTFSVHLPNRARRQRTLVGAPGAPSRRVHARGHSRAGRRRRFGRARDCRTLDHRRRRFGHRRLALPPRRCSASPRQRDAGRAGQRHWPARHGWLLVADAVRGLPNERGAHPRDRGDRLCQRRGCATRDQLRVHRAHHQAVRPTRSSPPFATRSISARDSQSKHYGVNRTSTSRSAERP